MDKKISNIKDRVLYISELQEIGKEKFFEELGVSYANFKGIQKKSALNSETIAKILTKYPEIDPEWLILGNGSHWRTSHISIEDVLLNRRQQIISSFDETKNYTSTNIDDDKYEFKIKEKDKIISTQDKVISSLERENELLREKIGILESKRKAG